MSALSNIKIDILDDIAWEMWHNLPGKCLYRVLAHCDVVTVTVIYMQLQIWNFFNFVRDGATTQRN